MKKLLNLLLCFVLLVSCIATFTACSDDDEDSSNTETGFTYELVTEDEESYLKVTGFDVSDEIAELVARGDYNNEAVKEVSVIAIPSEKVEYKVDGEVVGSYYVKEIAESAFANKLFIKKVVIPANVETIGSGCLAGVANLEELTISFVGNKKDGNVNGAKTLGYLFSSTEVSGMVSTTVNYNATGSLTCYIPANLKKITLTDGAVSDYAFYGFTSVEEVVLPEGLTAIGNYAFTNCTSLRTIKLASSVTKIGDGAFSGCTSLVSIALDSVAVIGDSAFSDCSQLFYSVNGSKYVASASLKSIGKSAFENCTSLETVDLSNLQGAIVKANAFKGLTSLTSVVLAKNGITYESDLVFTGATKLDASKVTNYNKDLKLFDFDYDI